MERRGVSVQKDVVWKTLLRGYRLQNYDSKY